ncbi:MAG: hypothetical protein ACUZ77_05910 [Candidatus Brocadiales bacterium]
MTRSYTCSFVLTNWRLQPMLRIMNHSHLFYLLVIPVAFAWPLVHIIVFLLRFGRMPTDSSLIFLPMGIISAVVLVFLLKKGESSKRKRSTVVGYLLASPFAFIGSLTGGLMLPPLLGTLVFGALPLVFGTSLGYKLGR